MSSVRGVAALALLVACQVPEDDVTSGTEAMVVADEGMALGGEWPPLDWPVPVRDPPELFLTLDGAPAAQNLIEARGSTVGQYALIVTDSCGLVLNGQINANSRWSPANGVNPLVGGRAYNLGVSSDYNQNAAGTYALIVAESNHDDLDYFQGFLLNETRYRFRIGPLGELAWGDGGVGLPHNEGERLEADVQLVHSAPGRLEVQTGTDHVTALAVDEQGVEIAGQRLEYGPPDSCGPGYRCLRVPNE